MSTDQKFKLDVFEGPLDLLLHLIRQNELEISEISISQITSQYLEMIRLLEALDLEVAGDYLVMATTLLNIKLRSLLPASEEEIEEQQEEELDNFLTARQLLQRLVEYRRFKEAGQALGRHAERQEQIFVRDVALPALQQAQADEAVQGDINLLLEAFQRVIRFIDRKGYHQVRAEEYNLDDKITMFRRRLVLEPRVALSEILNDCREKLEAIVTVIAILELCRLKELRVRQNDHFGDVFIFRLDAAPPDEYENDAPAGGQAGNGRKPSRRERKLAAAAALERIEAEIMANRTGVVDDGELPLDEEDRLLMELEAEARQQAANAAPAFIDPMAAQPVADADDEAEIDGGPAAEGAAETEDVAAAESPMAEAPLAEIVDAAPAAGSDGDTGDTDVDNGDEALVTDDADAPIETAEPLPSAAIVEDIAAAAAGETLLAGDLEPEESPDSTAPAEPFASPDAEQSAPTAVIEPMQPAEAGANEPEQEAPFPLTTESAQPRAEIDPAEVGPLENDLVEDEPAESDSVANEAPTSGVAVIEEMSWANPATFDSDDELAGDDDETAPLTAPAVVQTLNLGADEPLTAELQTAADDDETAADPAPVAPLNSGTLDDALATVLRDTPVEAVWADEVHPVAAEPAPAEAPVAPDDPARPVARIIELEPVPATAGETPQDPEQETEPEAQAPLDSAPMPEPELEPEVTTEPELVPEPELAAGPASMPEDPPATATSELPPAPTLDDSASDPTPFNPPPPPEPVQP